MWGHISRNTSYMVKRVDYANGMPDGSSNKTDNKKYPTFREEIKKKALSKTERPDE